VVGCADEITENCKSNVINHMTNFRTRTNNVVPIALINTPLAYLHARVNRDIRDTTRYINITNQVFKHNADDHIMRVTINIRKRRAY
jgi:hypothetical protein